MFSIVFKRQAAPHVAVALDTLQVFAIGASWGGTRSLAAPMSIDGFRTATSWDGPDIILRLSIGLEDETDLWTDVKRMLETLEAHATAASTECQMKAASNG